MSPEQIEGKEADARADIFAFGAVLYEMAMGKRAFEGKSQISVASSILEKDPDPISASKPSTPPAFDYLVAACLAKDREDRFQSAHDVRLQLKGISQSPQTPVAAAPVQLPRTFVPRALLAVAVVLLAAAGILFYLAERANSPTLSVRAYIPPPPGTAFRASGFDAGPVVVSPDGKTLSFSAVDDKGRTNLWLRPLDAQQATMLPSTEDAATPFWSPDSRYLAFVADRKLKTISVSGGDAQILTDAYEVYSGCGDWSPAGIILFCTQNFGPISQIAASGGQASPATRLDKNESNWECLANPNKMESTLPQGVVRRLLPIISCLCVQDIFRPSPSIRALSSSPAILKPSAKLALSPSPKTAFSPTTKVPPSPSSSYLTEAET
jgi:hypothetical protein